MDVETLPRRLQAPAPHSRHAPWTLERGLVLLGVAALVASPLALGAPALYLAWPVAPLLLVALGAGAAVAARGRPGDHLLAAVAVAALPVAAIAETARGGLLANPLATGEYRAGLVLLGTLAIAAPAGVRGFARARRAAADPPPRGVLGDPLAAYALAVACLLLGAALAATAASARAVEARAGGGYDLAPDARIALRVTDAGFDPTPLRVRAGVLTEVAVTNEDALRHTFTYAVADRSFHHELLPGVTTAFLVRFDALGTVAYRDLTTGATGELEVV